MWRMQDITRIVALATITFCGACGAASETASSDLDERCNVGADSGAEMKLHPELRAQLQGGPGDTPVSVGIVVDDIAFNDAESRQCLVSAIEGMGGTVIEN